MRDKKGEWKKDKNESSRKYIAWAEKEPAAKNSSATCSSVYVEKIRFMNKLNTFWHPASFNEMQCDKKIHEAGGTG